MFLRYRPPKPLSLFVDCIWHAEGTAEKTGLERLLPDGCSELIINLGEEETRIYDAEEPTRCSRLSSSIYCGPHARSFLIDASEQDQVAGVHFHPGGGFAFFATPLREMQNQHVALSDLWGATARELRERLLPLETARGRLLCLEQYLLQQLRSLGGERCVRGAVLALEQGARVKNLSKQLGVSERTLAKYFEKQVGLTPKLYARIRRFQRVLPKLWANPDPDLAGLALDGGFYDQAHFHHDFRSIAGITPLEYLARATRHPNHVSL